MSIIPELTPELEEQINNINQTSTHEVKKLGRCFLFDTEKKEFIVTDGRVIEVDGLTALRQWIQLILHTYKDKFAVYKDTDFYCNIEDLIGKKPNGFILSELKREITEALTKHRYIKSITNFQALYSKDKLDVSFTVNLVDGASISEGVTL